MVARVFIGIELPENTLNYLFACSWNMSKMGPIIEDINNSWRNWLSEQSAYHIIQNTTGYTVYSVIHDRKQKYIYGKDITTQLSTDPRNLQQLPVDYISNESRYIQSAINRFDENQQVKIIIL